jgi:hypothetical protein
VKFGEYSGYTAQYIPRGLNGAAPATARLDWSMLLMTVYDRMQPQGQGVNFTVQKMSTDDLLDWFQRMEYTELHGKMRANLAIEKPQELR